MENITNNSSEYNMSSRFLLPINRSVGINAFYALVTSYVILVITGAVGNILVCSVVIKNKNMRTAKNMLIVNLAFSDLILCLFTMPFSLVQIITKFWPLGNFMCKAVASFQATSVFVSTMTITFIAIDRYTSIVYATKRSNHRQSAMRYVCFKIIIIWISSLLLSSPLFVFRTVDRINLNLTELKYVEFCYEDWPFKNGGAIYSISTMVFQYVFPIIAVSFTYIRICMKLKYRFMSRQIISEHQKQKRIQEKTRLKRTNYLLISIACVFAVTWLPLNILNIISDLIVFESPEKFNIIFGSFLLIGMTSACSNPIFYGWFNENFKKEFRKILCRYETVNEIPGSQLQSDKKTENYKVTHL